MEKVIEQDKEADILFKASAISKFILNTLVPPSMLSDIEGTDDLEKAYNFIKGVGPC